MLRSRRVFLKLGAVGAGTLVGGGLWASLSQRRSARWLRRLVRESQRPMLEPHEKPKPTEWNDNAVTLCWLGHSSVLINFYGIRILTDPVLGSRVGISIGLGTLGPKRFIKPALTPDELPTPDLILLSHAHMDHMDLPTLRKLRATPQTITAKATQDILRGTGLKQVRELAWNDKTKVSTRAGDLEIQAFEVKHWGQRWPSEQPRGYNGYILRREGKALLFGGDTARTELFEELRSKGPFLTAIMPIGAYRPWIRNHCTPEQAVEMANAARSHYIVPVHHQTFKLSDEPMDEPIQRMIAALEKEPERLAVKQAGGTFVCPA